MEQFGHSDEFGRSALASFCEDVDGHERSKFAFERRTGINISVAKHFRKFWLSASKLEFNLLVFRFQLKGKPIKINGKQARRDENLLAGCLTL